MAMFMEDDGFEKTNNLDFGDTYFWTNQYFVHPVSNSLAFLRVKVMSLLAALSAADPDVVPESSCEDCEGFFPKSCPIRLFTSSTHLLLPLHRLHHLHQRQLHQKHDLHLIKSQTITMAWTTSSTSIHLHHIHHLHQLHLQVLNVYISPTKLLQFLHRISYTRVLTQELFYRSCCAGGDVQELLYRSCYTGVNF